MDKQLTAMQELFENYGHLFRQSTLEDVKKEYVAKEKEQIKQANIAGMEFIPCDPEKYESDAELYYSQTYKNE